MKLPHVGEGVAKAALAAAEANRPAPAADKPDKPTDAAKVEVGESSDPAMNTDSGYETKVAQGNRPEGMDAIVQYANHPIDEDIADSVDSLDSTEKILGKK